MIEVGEEVEFDAGDGAALRGTVKEIVTTGSVKDPMTGDELPVVDVDDPIMVLDTDEGRAAVYTSEAKSLPQATADGWAALVPLLAQFEADHEDDPEVVPSGRAVKTVFERGAASWPGPARTSRSQDEWALDRTRAFLEVAAGGEVPGYEADRDLLPS